MKRQLLFFALLTLTTVSCAQNRAGTELSQEVNPFIGTDFTGNTYPGAQAPFGMVQLSPDNGLAGWDRIAGYFYPDSTIAGFSHTHLSGTGAGDLYDISFMPVTLPYKESPAGGLGVYSKFRHSDEEASAGYYRVRLEDYKIDVELTATARCGIQRYTFPAAKSMVILNLRKAMNWDATTDSHVEIVDSCNIRGYRFSNGWARNQKVFFATRFSRPFKAVEIDSVNISPNDKRGMGYVARFLFDTAENEKITIVTALSGTSTKGAERNLAAEAPHNDFDKYRAAAKADWNSHLATIEIAGGSPNQRAIFYTALYRTMIAPTIFSDCDGSYRGPDGKIHKADGRVNYGTFSLWDTFRAAHPLLTYTQPHRVNSMIKSLLAFYEQSGRLPVWNMWGSETDMMIGYHSAAVIADAYLKNIGDFDAEKALTACIATANIDDYRGIGLYKQKGYIPYDVPDKYNSDNWSLSRTLEYAFDDYCIALMAEKMGKTAIADKFRQRSENYRNVYNPTTRFMQPRDSNGKFQPSFNPDEYTAHICESNAWHYFWSVQHNIEGLISLLGGKEHFADKLDSMFTHHPKKEDQLPLFSTGMIGQYVHGNEPSHHVIYLYNKVGQPWKTQKYTARVMHELYRNTPDGLCGNEDCGQMSAWYIFSAIGIYPVNPVAGEYEIGTPLFPEARLRLANGRTFTVLAPNVSRKNIYVRSVKVNGRPHDKSYITHEQIMSGATVELTMSDHPCDAWYPK